MKAIRMRSLFVLLVLFVSLSAPLQAAPAPDLDDQTRAIATELRCVVCQNLSVADSPSEMAQQMRAIVREQLQAGKSPEQIKDFFVSKYGEWVLLKPKTTGVSALLWILPYVALIVGVAAALWIIRRWVNKKRLGQPSGAPPPISQEIQSDLLREDVERPDLEDASAKAQLLRERARLRSELTDLDFDFQSGKLSESDYAGLKQEIEVKAAAVIQQLRLLPPEPAVKPAAADKSRAGTAKGRTHPAQFRRWQIIAGGTFLMLFGLVLGVMLTKSVRPRASENDTMTGDFLTGTTPASSEVRAALNEGKQAFENQEFPKAIEAFKKVLATDPENPEAHSYMGLILVQAGHGDVAGAEFSHGALGPRHGLVSRQKRLRRRA
jgi:cytochrome c-type biogenesis protein CcmH